MRKIPWITATLAGLALFVAVAGLYDPLAFDRRLVAEGQWWRVASSFLCHWSPFHLAVNLSVFLCVGGFAETRDRGRYAVALGVAVAAVAAGYLGLMPKEAGYGGLSPLSFAALGWVATRMMVGGEVSGVLPAVAVAAVYVGGFAEVFAGYSLLAHAPKTPALEALPAAHLMGAVAGGMTAYHQRPDKARPFARNREG